MEDEVCVERIEATKLLEGRAGAPPPEDGIVVSIRINRPRERNALASSTLLKLAKAVDEAGGDEKVGAIVISGGTATVDGAGNVSSYFTSGADLSGSGSGEREYGEDVTVAPPNVFMRSVYLCNKLVVAAVNGHAVGAGVTVLPHCDLVVVVEGGNLWTPFVALGIVPELSSSTTFPSILGSARGKAALLAGRKLSSEELYHCGFASHILPPTTPFLSNVLHLAASTAYATRDAPAAIKDAKVLIRSPHTLETAYKEYKILAKRVNEGMAMEATMETIQRRKEAKRLEIIPKL